MNRGNSFHRRQVERVADLWRRRPCEIFVEHRMTKGGVTSFVDVLVDVDGYRVAVEVELSVRHVLENARRDLRVGCHEVHLVFPTARLRDAARRRLTARLTRAELDRIRFLLLSVYQPATYARKNRFLDGKSSPQKTGKPEIESSEVE